MKRKSCEIESFLETLDQVEEESLFKKLCVKLNHQIVEKARWRKIEYWNEMAKKLTGKDLNEDFVLVKQCVDQYTDTYSSKIISLHFVLEGDSLFISFTPQGIFFSAIYQFITDDGYDKVIIENELTLITLSQVIIDKIRDKCKRDFSDKKDLFDKAIEIAEDYLKKYNDFMNKGIEF